MNIPRKGLSIKRLLPVMRLTSFIFLPLFLVSFSVTAYLFLTDLRAERLLLSRQEMDSVMLNAKLISSSFRSIVTDLLFLSEESELKELLEKDNPRERERLAQEWLEFSRTKKIYDQIRYINEEGWEVVRINKGLADSFKVPDHELQNKAWRYYFRQSINLSSGEIYVSPFDLNIERNVLELPVKPMIRFATPVTDSKGSKRGIVILNYLGQDLISRIKAVEDIHPGKDMLVNSSGYWLYSPDPQDCWGFMCRKERAFSTSFPAEWEKIVKTEKGVFFTEKGLFAFTTIYPGEEARKRTDTGAPEAFVSGARKGYFWKVISYIPSSYLEALEKRVRSRYLLPYAVFTFFLLAGAWVVALAWVRQKTMAERDSLTGAYNMRKFLSLMETEQERAKRYNRPLSLMMFDIDHFKSVNDSFGHHVGNHVLQTLVHTVRKIMRNSDILARYGGEEFILLCPETDLQGSSALAERLRRSIEGTYFGEAEKITVSIGVAQWRIDESGDDCIRRADKALYAAKEGGRNNVRVAE